MSSSATNVSLAEMGQMSQEARYWVARFLAGNQPGEPPPPDFGAPGQSRRSRCPKRADIYADEPVRAVSDYLARSPG
jgi:hypothetical protein